MSGSNALLMGPTCSDYFIINTASQQAIVGPIGNRWIYTIRGYGENIAFVNSSGGPITTSLGNINYTQIKTSNIFSSNIQKFYSYTSTYNGSLVDQITYLSVSGNHTSTSWVAGTIEKSGNLSTLYKSVATVTYDSTPNLTTHEWAGAYIDVPNSNFVLKLL